MIAELMSGDAVMLLLLDRAGKVASIPAETLEIKEDRSRRREEVARNFGVSREALEAFRADRWYPGAKLAFDENSQECPWVQVTGRDRSWNSKLRWAKNR